MPAPACPVQGRPRSLHHAPARARSAVAPESWPPHSRETRSFTSHLSGRARVQFRATNTPLNITPNRCRYSGRLGFPFTPTRDGMGLYRPKRLVYVRTGVMDQTGGSRTRDQDTGSIRKAYAAEHRFDASRRVFDRRAGYFAGERSRMSADKQGPVQPILQLIMDGRTGEAVSAIESEFGGSMPDYLRLNGDDAPPPINRSERQ